MVKIVKGNTNKRGASLEAVIGKRNVSSFKTSWELR